MSVEIPIPQDYITKNQEHFRNARRGILSRPIELPQTRKVLHERVVKTFGLEDTEKPILTWSVVFDNPETPSSEYVYAERYPEEIAEEDRQNFSIGISRINEYATNFATKEFIRRNADLPFVKQIASVYGEISNLFTYGLLLGGTFSRMRDIEIMANHNKKDYKKAVLDGLFQHDLTGINELIAMTSDYTGYSDINGLAIEIGKKRQKKPDIGKWFDKLDAQSTDGRVKAAIKHGIISVAAMGVSRNPGVIELSGAMLPAIGVVAPVSTLIATEGTLAAHNLGLVLINHPELIPHFLSDLVPVAGSSMAATAIAALSLLPFVGIHESIHHYSSDQEYRGYIPAKIIHKQIAPNKARLEIEG